MNKETTTKTRRFGWLPPMVLFVAVFALLQWWRAAPLASGQAPSLAGELVAGGRADLAALRGEPVLVHFWASWCPICGLGDDEIDALARDFQVLTVAMQSGGASEVRVHLQRENLSFPTINDAYGELASRWGVQAVPASFVVDGKGVIRFATVGHTTGIGLRARLWAAAVE
jgi:thiol-disulfide isomerase/thioredoxin